VQRRLKAAYPDVPAAVFRFLAHECEHALTLLDPDTALRTTEH
jgi:hypothetical protein